MTKRKKIKTFILILASLLFLILVYSFVNSYYTKQAREIELSQLPDIPLRDLSGNTFNLNELQGIKLLVFMDTDCSYCKYQIEEFKEIKKQLNDLTIVGISEQPLQRLKDYKNDNTFFNEPHNFITHDYDSDMANHFGIGTTPHLLIYNETNQLIKQNKGFMKADQLIAIIEAAK
jgi:thioredoxin-related protein